MSGKQEMTADIIAEMRDATMNGEYDDETVNDWADRIEAAAKRERGNAAAMRKALVWLQKTGHRTPEGGWMCINLKMTQKDGRLYPIEVPPYAEDVINDALSYPPKNCDLYDNKTDAEIGFIEETEEDDNNPLYWQLFANWLFSTAAERKGDNYGK